MELLLAFSSFGLMCCLLVGVICCLGSFRGAMPGLVEWALLGFVGLGLVKPTGVGGSENL